MDDVRYGEIRGYLRAYEALNAKIDCVIRFSFTRFSARPDLESAVAAFMKCEGKIAQPGLVRSGNRLREDIVRYAHPWLMNYRLPDRSIPHAATKAKLGWGEDLDDLLELLQAYFAPDEPEVWEFNREAAWTGLSPYDLWDALVLRAGDTAHLFYFGWTD